MKFLIERLIFFQTELLLAQLTASQTSIAKEYIVVAFRDAWEKVITTPHFPLLLFTILYLEAICLFLSK